jgi:aromatic-ring opening dioxygenase LigAB LigA subunit
VSVYAVNKLCRRVVHEPALRAALAADPEPALRAARPPLSEEELRALLAGDVGTLSQLGCNHFLLHQLGRWQVLGLDLPLYAERIRAAHRAERAAAAQAASSSRRSS